MRLEDLYKPVSEEGMDEGSWQLTTGAHFPHNITVSVISHDIFKQAATY